MPAQPGMYPKARVIHGINTAKVNRIRHFASPS